MTRASSLQCWRTQVLASRCARAYTPWQQVAGYFDGDGAVYVSAMRCVLKVRLCFYDVWKPQLDAVRNFVQTEGMRLRRLSIQRKRFGAVWYLTISDSNVVRTVIRRTSPFACKKKGDLLIALDYLDNRISADEAIARLNECVRSRRRSGHIRRARTPYTRSEGTLVGRRLGAREGAMAARVYVPPQIRKGILTSRKDGRTLPDLQFEYGLGIRVIRRVLKEAQSR